MPVDLKMRDTVGAAGRGLDIREGQGWSWKEDLRWRHWEKRETMCLTFASIILLGSADPLQRPVPLPAGLPALHDRLRFR